MSEIDTPFKRAVHAIIYSIIDCEDEYVLDKRYIRWGKVERDLWALENLVSQSNIPADGIIRSQNANADSIGDEKHIFSQSED